MVKVRVEAHAVPPSMCFTLVESRLQLSFPTRRASALASSGMLAGLQASGIVPCGALIVGAVASAVQVESSVLVALFRQASVTTMVKVRVEAHAVPPSTCVTLVESRLQLSPACTNANTATSEELRVGKQARGLVPCGALIVGGGVSAVQV